MVGCTLSTEPLSEPMLNFFIWRILVDSFGQFVHIFQGSFGEGTLKNMDKLSEQMIMSVYWENHKIALVPVKEIWRIWVKLTYTKQQ